MSGENPKDRIGAYKPPLHLIPPAAETLEAVVMCLGTENYGPFNWRSTNVHAFLAGSAARNVPLPIEMSSRLTTARRCPAALERSFALNTKN